MSIGRQFFKKSLSGVTVGAVARYALLPGIIPRLNRLIFSIQHIFFCFIRLLGACDLIDRNHPCLKVENIGKYKFSHVLLLAWNNLEFKRDNIPKIVMFFAVLASIVLMTAIFCVLILQLFVQLGNTAHAQSFYFQSPNPQDIGTDYYQDKDWIFVFLDRIFGTTGIIDFWTAGTTISSNKFFSDIFSGLMSAYSKAMFVLAIFMIIYLLFVTLADAAKTGEPFGKRFDSIWAPIRMAMALFLLLPITGSSYNPAQFLVFASSEWGTNLANNVWLRTLHNMVTQDQNQDEAKKRKNTSFINVANVDKGHRFVRDVFLIHLCVKGFNLLECSAGAQNAAVTVTMANDESSVIYQFGVPNAKNYCGEIRVPAPFPVPKGAPGNDGTSTDATQYWPNKVIQGYTDAITNLIAPDYSMPMAADKMVSAFDGDSQTNFSDIADPTQIKAWIDDYRKTALGLNDINGKSFEAYETQNIAYNRWIVNSIEKDAKYGWGAAGVFYLRMTGAMGVANKAIEGMPTVSVLPTNFTRMYATPDEPNISNEMGHQRCLLKELSDPGYCDENTSPRKLYALLDKGSNWFSSSVIADPQIYADLGGIQFNQDLRVAQKEKAEESRQDAIWETVASNLLNMAKLSANDLHPLGTVINWGHTFMDLSFKSYNVAVTAGYLSGAVKILTGGLLNLGSPISLIAISIGNLFLIPGFMLAFIVPFIPAYYFMFAVLEWIISIVEAVIAMPLWALSFLTLEGDLLGEGLTGIQSLFEIILRPLMIIIGLVFSVTIFTAGITFINDSYALFLGAYSDVAEMGPMASIASSLASTLIYIFLVYTYATSCFKLIDKLPERFTEWLDLPAGFNTMISAGHHNMRKQLLEGALITRMFSNITGILPKFSGGASDVKSSLGSLFRKKKKKK